ncbi:hypothetical protein [Planobispora takensis]|uniref:Uncharacterized protein n=1 Tax=Planobispora takensis TaxID=1367882 RepID=A0A8J3SZV1_9ACTN|nr:hypothetical protein [Planobispora takensis]GII02300.1 hypothetical protein Pta02_43080 [Planobispora takensis]
MAQAQEWGRRQAARSPKWTADKWRRVATVLGVEIRRDAPQTASEDTEEDVA